MSAYKKPQQLDVRKFIRLVNSGISAQLNEASECIRKAGEKVNRNWQLVALNGNEILFEDATSEQYLIAKYSSKPRPILENITPIDLIDEGKKDDFAEACKMLVEGIEADDKKATQNAFNRMGLARYSSKIVPESNRIRCRDGKVYSLQLNESTTFTPTEIKKITEGAKQHYSNGVVIEEGKIVGYSSDKGQLKISPYLPFDLRAKSLRQAALNGHTNTAFKNAVLESANLLSQGQQRSAAKTIGKQLQIDEEFTLLSQKEMVKVVENCLATEAVFNDILAEDIGTMAHQLNLKLHRDTIVQTWRTTAKKAGSTALLENVHRLENAPNFDSAHNKFIYILFEDAGGRDTKVLMLRTTLEKMASDIPGIAKDPTLNEKMQSLIGRLKSDQVDEATIFEAEDVVAAVGDELKDTETLDDFDNVDSDPEGFDLTDDLEDGTDDLSDGLDDDASDAVGSMVSGGSGGQPVTIEINSPLIQVGGESAAAAGTEAPALDDGVSPDLGGEDLDVDLADAGEGEDLADELGDDGDPLDDEEEGDDDFNFDLGDEDEDEEDNPFGEGVSYEMKQGSEDDMPSTSYPKKIQESVGTYGQKLLKNSGLLGNVVEEMRTEMFEGAETIEEAARNAIHSLRISFPKSTTWQIVKEAVQAFEESADEMVDETIDEEVDCKCPKCNCEMVMQDGKKACPKCQKVGEDQIRGPNITPIGIANSDNRDPMVHGKINEDVIVTWNDTGDGLSHGVCEGINFILGHSDLNKMELRSADGAVTVPVPTPLCESALGSLELADTDPRQFNAWVGQIAESLITLEDLDDYEIDSAIDHADGEEEPEMLSVYGDDNDSDDMYELRMVKVDSEDIPVEIQPDGTVISKPGATDGTADEAGIGELGSDGEDEAGDDESDGDDDDSGPPTPPTPKSDGEGDGESSDDDSDDDDSDEEAEDEGSEGPSDESESDEDGSDEGEDEGEGDDAKPAFLEGADEDGKPDFIKDKIKANQGDSDDSDKEEKINEGPYDRTDESFDANLSLYWYNNDWYIGDGSVGTADELAPAAVRRVAAKIGLTKKVLAGQIDPEQVLFDVLMNVDFGGESFGGDRSGPMGYGEAPFDNRSSNVVDAKIKLDLPDGSTKMVQMDSEEIAALNDELAESLTTSARDRMA